VYNFFISIKPLLETQDLITFLLYNKFIYNLVWFVAYVSAQYCILYLFKYVIHFYQLRAK